MDVFVATGRRARQQSSQRPQHYANSSSFSPPGWASQPSAASHQPPPSPGFSTSLPPLNKCEAASLPRKESSPSAAKVHSARDSRTSSHYQHDQNEAVNRQSGGLHPSHHVVENDYPVAQLDSWPLTSRTSSYKRPFAGEMATPSSPEKKHLSFGDSEATNNSCSATQVLRINHDFNTSASSHIGQTVSPISPRQRKAHQRHILLDESKSRPLLLQELQAFVDAELTQLARQQANNVGDAGQSRIQDTPPGVSLQRLQVFREVFQRVISAFSVYAPVLSQIQSEYERVVTRLRSQCLQIPSLHSQLQTLQTKCVHELSSHSLESKLYTQALKRQLKGTQGKLTALAAQNAVLQDQNAQLETQIAALELRSAEMQLSNHSLVNGMKRHDDTLRHIHERSREEGLALQQMGSKYHHACDEIAELKRTIASLEEKVGGVHVAADKATIALLTRELQEIHGKLHETLTSTSVGVMSELQTSLAQQTALSHAFVKVLGDQGVDVNVHELLAVLLKNVAGDVAGSESAGQTQLFLSCQSASRGETAASRSTAIVLGGEYAEATEAVAAWVIDKIPLKNATGRISSIVGDVPTFLTEPEETLSLESASLLLSSSKATNDFFTGKGFGADVPEYLQCGGLVRNLHFPKKKLEMILARVWQQKDDLEKIKRSHFASMSSGSSPGTIPSATASASLGSASAQQASGGVVSLAKVFSMMLSRMSASKSEATESAYNVLAALERFAPHSSDCRLFLAILQGEIPEEARQDQRKEVFVVHDALAALEKEHNSSGSGGTGTAAPGRVPLADVVQILRHVFPWKSEPALSALYRALFLDQRGHALVDYAALLLQQQEDKRIVKSQSSQFVETLRAQYIDDLLAYRHHLQTTIQLRLAATGGSESSIAPGTLVSEATGASPDTALAISPPPALTNTSAMVSIRALREILQECDVAKPVQEINRLLATAAGLSMDQILTQDAMMMGVQQFLRKLPTLLVKPTGKFQSAEGSVMGPVASLH